MANKVAEFTGIDKITGRIINFDIYIGETVQFGALQVTPVQPRADAAAIRVLVAGMRGSRAPFTLAPALVLHGPDGRFTAEVEAMHRGEGP